MIAAYSVHVLAAIQIGLPFAHFWTLLSRFALMLHAALTSPQSLSRFVAVSRLAFARHWLLLRFASFARACFCSVHLIAFTSHRFGKTTGSTSKDGCLSCEPGFVCPSPKSEPVPCSAGTFNSEQ